MALLPFLQKKSKPEEELPSGGEKKIDFAGKLPAEDLEGKPSPKGGSFDFSGEDGRGKKEEGSAPVKIKPEEPARPTAAGKGDYDEEEEKKENWFSRLLAAARQGKIIGGAGRASRALEVNLVRGEIVKYFDWQKGIVLLAVFIFSAMAALSLCYWLISWWGANRQYSTDNAYLQQYIEANREIKNFEPEVDEILKFKAKLDVAKFLLDRHVYWTNLFTFLENNTLSDVYFSGFTGDINGNYTLAATTNSVDAIDAQIKKLLVNSNIKKAEVSAGMIGGQGGNTAVTFSLSFSLNPKIFLK
jgi:hypothetical protein